MSNRLNRENEFDKGQRWNRLFEAKLLDHRAGVSAELEKAAAPGDKDVIDKRLKRGEDGSSSAAHTALLREPNPVGRGDRL